MSVQTKAQKGFHPHRFDPVVLREYDIRGQVGKNLHEADAYALGLHFASWLREDQNDASPDICVGYDGRLTSPALSRALIEGLMQAGARVRDVGLGPSPLLYFAVKESAAAAGIMVTGSHNPADYNGFKIMLQKSPFYGRAILDLGARAEAGHFAEAAGSTALHDFTQDYINRLLRDYTGKRPLKVAWDAGNGAAGEITRQLTARLPGTHHLLYADIDGRFPNHHPDPTVDKNLQDLRALVLREGCDVGIAFDGDGDRIGVVDDKGNVLRCDMLMTIYARDILRDHPGAPIIGDIKCSQVMFQEIARMGGQPVMWKTGHSLIKAKMQELQAPLAGELSGHIFFADRYYGYDDALYCAVRLLNAVDAGGAGLSALTRHLPPVFNTPEIRFEVAEEHKFAIVETVRAAAIARAKEDGAEISDIDGVRVSTPEGWWLLRASNTQNALVARIESHSAQGLEKLKALAAGALRMAGLDLSFDPTDH